MECFQALGWTTSLTEKYYKHIYSPTPESVIPKNTSAFENEFQNGIGSPMNTSCRSNFMVASGTVKLGEGLSWTEYSVLQVGKDTLESWFSSSFSRNALNSERANGRQEQSMLYSGLKRRRNTHLAECVCVLLSSP